MTFAVDRAIKANDLSILQVMRFQSIKAHERLPENLNDHFRFLFVRNPYSRLWSSYVDKFFLLDFWPLYGAEVLEYLHTSSSSARGVATLGELPRSSAASSECPSSHISFAQFAAYVAWSGESSPQALNEHWRPVEHLCHPCLFCPHLVGRVETFHVDSLPALRRLNLSRVLGTYRHGRHQMELLVDENFGRLSFSGGGPSVSRSRVFYYYSSCTNLTDVSRRLWAAFQMYGYIPEASPFPYEELGGNPTAEAFKEVLFRTYREVPDGVRVTLSAQRQRAMEAAYRSVPLGVLEKLSSLYSYEFAAFGYDMRPYELFGARYDDKEDD